MISSRLPPKVVLTVIGGFVALLVLVLVVAESARVEQSDFVDGTGIVSWKPWEFPADDCLDCKGDGDCPDHCEPTVEVPALPSYPCTDEESEFEQYPGTPSCCPLAFAAAERFLNYGYPASKTDSIYLGGKDPDSQRKYREDARYAAKWLPSRHCVSFRAKLTVDKIYDAATDLGWPIGPREPLECRDRDLAESDGYSEAAADAREFLYYGYPRLKRGKELSVDEQLEYHDAASSAYFWFGFADDTCEGLEMVTRIYDALNELGWWPQFEPVQAKAAPEPAPSPTPTGSPGTP